MWVDETSSDARNYMRKFGFSLRGMRAECHCIIVRGERISAHCEKLEVELTLKGSRWWSTSFCKGLVLHPLSSEGF